MPANQQSMRKIKEDKEIWEKLKYFSAFLFTMEDDKQSPALGLFFLDSEGEPLSRSDVLDQRVKRQENQKCQTSQKKEASAERMREQHFGLPRKKKIYVLSFKIGTLKTESCRGALSVIGC